MKLHQAGIFGKAMVRILEVLRRAGFDSPAEVAIDVTPGGDVIVAPSAGVKLSVRNHPGQLLLNWDCRGTAAEVRQLLKRGFGESPASAPQPVKNERDDPRKKRLNQERRA
jgi:hypothetical protein